MHAPAAPQPFTVSHRSVLAIALPLTLAYLSTPIVGLADTVVVGQIGDAALVGGIAVAAILFDLFSSTFGFLRMGTGGLTAQAFGAGDRLALKTVLIRAVTLAAVLGLALLALERPILAGFVPLMGASDEVEAALRAYVGIRILALPCAFVNYAILGWVIGLGRAGIGLALQTVLNGLNIVLNVVLALGLGWGLAGVAWATAIAETATAVLGIAVVLVLAGGGPWPTAAAILERAGIVRLLAVNRDIMIRSLVMMAAYVSFTAWGARAGDVTLAANAILMNFFMLGALFLDGFAAAAEQLAGRAIGARWRPAFEQAVRLSLLWGFALGGAASVALYVAGPLLIDFATTAEAVRTEARQFMPWTALMPVAAVGAFVLDGVYIGATWTRQMRDMMLVSLALYAAAWATLAPVLGNHGLWFAFLVFLGARGVTLWMRLPGRLAASFPPG